MHFKVSAVLPIDAHTFLVERDSAAFRALVAKTQKLGALEIEDGWWDGEVQVFKLVTKPDMDRFVPKRLQHYLPGGGLEYTDIIRYDPQLLEKPPFKLVVHSIPPVFQKKTTIDCELTIEEEGDGCCRQTLEGDVTINVMGLGRIAEKIICSSLHDVYSGIPEIVERWKVFRDEVLQRPDGREVLFNGRPPLQEGWVSQQVADVLRSPYSKTASHAQPSQDGGTAAAGDNAVAATAKPGLGKAAAPNMAEGSINGPAPTGNAKDLQESAVMQQREGVVAREGQGASASQQQQGQAPQAQRQGQAQQQGAQHRVSPFAGAADRFSIDSGQPSHTSQHMGGSPQADRSRSVANFEGELFYEPDDNPDDIDPETASSLRTDHAEAMDWYRGHSVTGQPVAPISAIEEEASDSAASEAAGDKRKWWRRHSRGQSLGGANDSGPGVDGPAAMGPSRNANNYSHWANFWERQSVAKQDPAQKAGTRLGYLFGTAVKLGLVQPGHSRGASKGGGAAARNEDGSSPGSRLRKTVGFAHPVVDGVREATPGVSDDEDSTYDDSRDKLCCCFPMPRNRH